METQIPKEFILNHSSKFFLKYLNENSFKIKIQNMN